jgi:hypothetical protein
MKTCFFLILLFSLSTLAQTKYSTVSGDFILFHENISSAERMFKNDSLLQAYAKFDNAFSNYNGVVNPGHYFRAALCAIKIQEEYKGLNFLEKAITNGYEIDSAKKDEIVFYNQNTKKEYLNNIKKWEAQRDDIINYDWTNELYSSLEKCKKFTVVKYTSATEYCTACMKNKSCSKTAADYVSKIRLVKEKMKADSISASVLLKNIKQFGFPSIKLVGKEASKIARTILLNYDADKNNGQLDGMLSKALLEGNISPEFYATLIDRRNLMNGSTPEFYEPLAGYEKTIGKEITAANNKRNSIGLYNIVIVSAVAPKSKDPKAVKKLNIGLYDY